MNIMVVIIIKEKGTNNDDNNNSKFIIYILFIHLFIYPFIHLFIHSFIINIKLKNNLTYIFQLLKKIFFLFLKITYWNYEYYWK